MPPASRVLTCVNCRQMKVRCNARELFPASCSRCSKRNLDCFVDPSFKRTAKRKRAEQLEEELKAIKNGVHMSPMSTEPESIPSQAPFPADPLPPVPSAPIAFGDLIPSSAFKTHHIGDIALLPPTIVELLTCYFNLHHEEFPILPDLHNFIQSYDKCPLLFWVVVATAAKSLAQYAQLYTQLEPHIRVLATSLHTAIDHPLETVQALLLLCWWPLSFGAKRTDPSWIYSGLASHLALQCGLHRPHHHSDFEYKAPLGLDDIQAFRKAWVGCFIVNQNIGSELGLPSTVAPDATILSALNSQEPRLPRVLEQHLRIALHSYHICHTLGNNDSTPSGMHPASLGMIKIFDQGFKDLELKLGRDLSPCIQMTLFRVKLQLYSFVLTDHAVAKLGACHGQQGVTFRITEYLLKAKQVAMQLVDVAALHARSPPSVSSSPSSPPPRAQWPSIARISVTYGSQVLLKLLDYSEHPDNELIKNSIGQAWMLLNSRSELEHDSWARMSAIIAYLSRGSPGNTTSVVDKPKPVSARMSANLVYDGVWRARGRFSEQVLREKPGDYTAAEAVKDMVELGFNFAADWEMGDGIAPEALQQPVPLDLMFGTPGT